MECSCFRLHLSKEDQLFKLIGKFTGSSRQSKCQKNLNEKKKEKKKERKYHDHPEKKRQAVQTKDDDEKESIKHYKKEKYMKNMKNQTSNITYQKAKYQENSAVQLVHKNANT